MTLAANAAEDASLDMPAMIGPYRPIRSIGKGGMASVYQAVHPHQDNTTVAIKQILPQFAVHAEFRAAFARELATTTAFQHANVVCTLDHGLAADGTAYMVMELVDGMDLRSFQKAHDGHQLPPHWVVSIALNLAHALEYVHNPQRAAGPAVLHRDISPQNILMTLQGVAKLTDFGIAKVVDSDGAATATAAISGKIFYMSPEQAMGAELDVRADLYSLGLVLYELVSGDRAFPGQSGTKVFGRVAAAERRPLADVAPEGTPPILIEIIEGLLHREREDRTPNASTLLRQLLPLAPNYIQRVDLANAVAKYKSATPRAFQTPSVVRSIPSQQPDITMEVHQGDLLTAAQPRPRRLPPPEEVTTDAPTKPKALVSVPAPPADLARKPRSAPRWRYAAAGAALVATAGALAAFYSSTAGTPEALPGHLEGPALTASPEAMAPAAAPPPPPAIAAAAPPPAGAQAPAADLGVGTPTPAATPEPVEPAAGGPAAPPAPPAPQTPAPAPPVERTRPAASAAPGTVRVVVLPWGDVWADGTRAGQAPQTLTLRPGRHTIAVGQGTQTERRTVTVRSGDTATVRFDLREEP